MSIKCMNWIWTESDTTNGDLLMLLSMADFANDQGVCWPSYATLAEKCRVTERTAIRTIDKLVMAGHIEKMVGGGHVSNRYRVIMSNPTPDVDVTPDKLSRDADVTPALTPTSPQPCRPRHPIHQQPSTTTNGGGGDSKSYVGHDEGWRNLRAAYETAFGVVPPQVHLMDAYDEFGIDRVLESIDDCVGANNPAKYIMAIWKRWRAEPVIKSIDDREQQTFIDPTTGERLEI